MWTGFSLGKEEKKKTRLGFQAIAGVVFLFLPVSDVFKVWKNILECVQPAGRGG